MQLLLASDGHRVRVGEGMRHLRALIMESSNATTPDSNATGAPIAARASEVGTRQEGDQVGGSSQVGGSTQVGTWSLERSGCPSAEPAASLGNQPAATGPCGPYWAGLQVRGSRVRVRLRVRVRVRVTSSVRVRVRVRVSR